MFGNNSNKESSVDSLLKTANVSKSTFSSIVQSHPDARKMFGLKDGEKMTPEQEEKALEKLIKSGMIAISGKSKDKNGNEVVHMTVKAPKTKENMNWYEKIAQNLIEKDEKRREDLKNMIKSSKGASGAKKTNKNSKKNPTNAERRNRLKHFKQTGRVHKPNTSKDLSFDIEAYKKMQDKKARSE